MTTATKLFVDAVVVARTHAHVVKASSKSQQICQHTSKSEAITTTPSSPRSLISLELLDSLAPVLDFLVYLVKPPCPAAACPSVSGVPHVLCSTRTRTGVLQTTNIQC